MNIFSWMVMAISTLPQDLKLSCDYMETMRQLNYWQWNNYKVYQIFDEVAENYPQKVALRLDYETWTFHMLQEYSWKVANYFHTAGLQQGDVVAQVGVVGPRSMGLWLGLSRLGVATAILPSHLSPNSMIQAASSVYSKAIICDSKLVGDLKQQTLPDYMTIFSTEPTQDKSVIDLKKKLADLSSTRFKEIKKITINEKLLYLFSDTLAPIPVTNYRYTYIAAALHNILDLTEKDILYLPILEPESEGSIVGLGQAVIFGNSIVSRGEFVASNYFPDCNNYGATVALYTEVIVKDLLALPPSAADTKHNVRLVMGKGLRNSQTWTQFKDRFKIDHIGEYFGSIDGESYNMVNPYNKAGAVGYYPWFFSPLFHIDMVSYDPNTGDIIRNTNGLCNPSEHGKPGILISELPKDYTKNKFTLDKNIITDVFKKGDAYINTGNILIKDEQGYFYAVDTVADIKRRNSLSQTQSESPRNVEDTQTQQETAKVSHSVEQGEDDNSSPEHVMGLQQVDDDELDTVQHVAHGASEAVQQPEIHQQTQIEPQVEQKSPPVLKVEQQSEPPPVYEDIEESFQEAANAVQMNGENLSIKDKLQLYGLYKQATLGNINTARPWLGPEVPKWDAWKANEKMPKITAMQNYTTKAKSLGLIS